MAESSSAKGGDGGTLLVIVEGKLSGSGSITADGGDGAVGGDGGHVQVIAGESDFAGRVSADGGGAVPRPRAVSWRTVLQKHSLKATVAIFVAVAAVGIARLLGWE